MGPFAVSGRSCFIALVCLTLVAGIALPAIWAQAVDSNRLVGKWEGTWVNLSHPNARGDYSMTVTKVEGNRVHGRIEKQNYPAGSSGFDFIGTLEGGKLTYGSSSTSTELILNGSQLRGTSIDNFRLAIEMTMAK